MSASDWRPGATLDIIRLRARVLQDTRAFFQARGVLEVETPALSPACASDRHIKSLSSCVAATPVFLNASPEYAMKRLLAAWGEPIYQVCRVFRDDEIGTAHNPEFSMLEWYRPGFELNALMDEVQALIETLRPHPAPGFSRLSYRQAFESAAGFNPHTTSAVECRQCAREHQIEVPLGLEDDIDEWLDWLLTQLVLPALPQTAFTFVYDYPASQCALAKVGVNDKGDAIAHRFELLYGELELANGFFELRDADEQAARFAADNAARLASGMPAAVIDQNLLAALAQGLPECSGVALGLDRLMMVLSSSASIDEVMTFSWPRT